MANFEQIFESNVFSDSVMKKRLSPATYEKLHRVIAEGGELDIAVANEIAKAMKEWAMENGATHYTHFCRCRVTARCFPSFREKSSLRASPMLPLSPRADCARPSRRAAIRRGTRPPTFF